MKKVRRSSSFKYVMALGLTCLSFLVCCKKEETKKPPEQQIQLVPAEIDIQKIAAQTGIRFRIVKTDVRGYMPIHKFFWICVPDQTPREKVEGLVREIIKATVEKHPNTYHSFTAHLFYENELTGKPEDCRPFARATFLPEGDWLKVGRAPIDDYKNYQLSLEFTGKEK